MLRTLAIIVGLSSIAAADEPQTYPLWPKGTATDAGDENHAGDIPTITVHLPPKDKATGTSIVICPGGQRRSGRDRASTTRRAAGPAGWGFPTSFC